MNIKSNALYNKALDLTKDVTHAVRVINYFSLVLILLILIIFFLQYNRHKETYFAKTVNGNTIPMQTLDEFSVSPKSLLNWSMIAVTNIYTIDFVNYENSLNQMQEFFTKQGFLKFKQSLETSDRLNDIISNKLISSAVVVDSPIIIREGVNGSNYFWEIQLPIAITYQGASSTTYKQWVAVNLVIKKVPTTEAAKGIGIENITDQSMPPIY